MPSTNAEPGAGEYMTSRQLCTGFDVLTAAIMKSSIFWDIMSFSQLKVNWRFRRTCLQARNQHEADSKLCLLHGITSISQKAGISLRKSGFVAQPHKSLDPPLLPSISLEDKQIQCKTDISMCSSTQIKIFITEKAKREAHLTLMECNIIINTPLQWKIFPSLSCVLYFQPILSSYLITIHIFRESRKCDAPRLIFSGIPLTYV
jgi:hypothetical protein